MIILYSTVAIAVLVLFYYATDSKKAACIGAISCLSVALTLHYALGTPSLPDIPYTKQRQILEVILSQDIAAAQETNDLEIKSKLDHRIKKLATILEIED